MQTDKISIIIINQERDYDVSKFVCGCDGLIKINLRTRKQIRLSDGLETCM